MIFLISRSIFKYPAQGRSSCSTLRLLYLMITWTLLLKKIKKSHFTLKGWIYHEFHIFELRDKEINVDRGDHHSYWYARLFTVPYFPWDRRDRRLCVTGGHLGWVWNRDLVGGKDSCSIDYNFQLKERVEDFKIEVHLKLMPRLLFSQVNWEGREIRKIPLGKFAVRSFF